ncbi:MAG: hypothetical protein OEV31_00915 [Gammaproteobacteria bacterium]|nr:hypothetical protein [Gammaproteobacteria bacterium]
MALWLATAAAASVAFDPAGWPAPHRAEDLIANAPLADLVREFENAPGQSIRIRHPGGEAGTGKAETLRAALIALGVPGARIRLEPGATENDVLLVETTHGP